MLSVTYLFSSPVHLLWHTVTKFIFVTAIRLYFAPVFFWWGIWQRGFIIVNIITQLWCGNYTNLKRCHYYHHYNVVYALQCFSGSVQNSVEDFFSQKEPIFMYTSIVCWALCHHPADWSADDHKVHETPCYCGGSRLLRDIQHISPGLSLQVPPNRFNGENVQGDCWEKENWTQNC